MLFLTYIIEQTKATQLISIWQCPHGILDWTFKSVCDEHINPDTRKQAPDSLFIRFYPWFLEVWANSSLTGASEVSSGTWPARATEAGEARCGAGFLSRLCRGRCFHVQSPFVFLNSVLVKLIKWEPFSNMTPQVGKGKKKWLRLILQARKRCVWT